MAVFEEGIKKDTLSFFFFKLIDEILESFLYTPSAMNEDNEHFEIVMKVTKNIMDGICK